MEQEIDVQDVLAAMREIIGNLSQENAILSARIKALNEDWKPVE